MKKITLIAFLSFLIVGQAYSQTSKSVNAKNMKQAEGTDHYTFQLSDKVTRQKVSFKNRYGITLTGDLYLPKHSVGKILAAPCYQWSFWRGERTIIRFVCKPNGRTRFCCAGF